MRWTKEVGHLPLGLLTTPSPSFAQYKGKHRRSRWGIKGFLFLEGGEGRRDGYTGPNSRGGKSEHVVMANGGLVTWAHNELTGSSASPPQPHFFSAVCSPVP